ncbi:MAG: DUF559 domain-containing protein [Thermoleophilaceae bacterium]
MDTHIAELAASQADIVAAWQLVAVGATRRMIDHRVGDCGWRTVHPGVYALSHAPLTWRQRWMAATLTTPDSVLSHASAAACWGIRPFTGSFDIITRPGKGGPRRQGKLLVCRSSTLDGDVTRHEGIAITTPERVLIDLSPGLGERQTARAFREAIRLKTTTARRIGLAVSKHRGRRGTNHLKELADRYAGIPYSRTRSNAEARALEVLDDAGVEPPKVNIKIAGEEADLAWPERKRIVEIDGPQYHLFEDEDARKQARWEAAGYVVRRIGSDAIYDEPAALIALVGGR